MKIYHLNCATLCPPIAKLVNGTGGWFSPGKLVCHCVLIESNHGLILVDTGLGLQDVSNPHRLGLSFQLSSRPRLDPEETALRQIMRLGFQQKDVRHLVVTHLDLDHAGGISDFPDAQVHIFSEEYKVAQPPYSFKNQDRYVPSQWTRHSHWAFHFPESGESWYGFEAVNLLEGVSPEVLLIPLPGHTLGHCGVAISTPKGWLLHCGDSYFYRGEVHGSHRQCPPALRL